MRLPGGKIAPITSTVAYCHTRLLKSRANQSKKLYNQPGQAAGFLDEQTERRFHMPLKLLSLEGLRALVTGAGTGLGKQMALGLAEAGAGVEVK